MLRLGDRRYWRSVFSCAVSRRVEGAIPRSQQGAVEQTIINSIVQDVAPCGVKRCQMQFDKTRHQERDLITTLVGRLSSVAGERKRAA